MISKRRGKKGVRKGRRGRGKGEKYVVEICGRSCGCGCGCGCNRGWDKGGKTVPDSCQLINELKDAVKIQNQCDIESVLPG